MRKLFTLLFLVSLAQMAYSQVYIDNFDAALSNVAFGQGLSGSTADGEWTITGDGTSGQWEVFTYTPTDADGNAITLDMTENNKVFLGLKASNLGTQFRMDVQDAAGYATTLAGITKTLVSDYSTFEYDYSGNYSDGGYGGTSCDSGSAPCPVDGTQIAQFVFYINPGQGAFSGSVVMDFLSVGDEPTPPLMSDVWQDHFDNPNTLTFMSMNDGFQNIVEDSKWIIRADGTNATWTNVNMLFNNPATGDTIDVSTADGDDKLYVRMRTSTPLTTVRIDLQDINDMATTLGSVTNPITDEWATYEFNYSTGYQDLAYGGTGCAGPDPCPVDPNRIANLILFVNPGSEAFVGDVEIEYMSIGTPLEASEEEEGVLEYGDHFSSDRGAAVTEGLFDLSYGESALSISSAGGAAPYSSISYNPIDDVGGNVLVNNTANNLVYIRAKADADNTLLRLDLVDSTGYVTTEPSFTVPLSSEYEVFKLNFTGRYIDKGYGGSACETGMGDCLVDPTAIDQVLLYPNPADGGFAGKIDIDYISFGAPMGDDFFMYSDHFDNEDRSQWSDADGFTVEETGTELIITGDGSAGPYAAFNFTPHDTETGNAYVLDVTSNNKVYIKAKSTVDAPLRIDLLDAEGYATTAPSVAASVGAEYTVLEYDFSGTYMDGGYGGTSCDGASAPCPVDGTQVASFLVYIDPDNGGYNGTMTIDWISIIEPLEAINTNEGPKGIDDYVDEFSEGNTDNVEGQDGLTLAAEEDLLKIIGDGTSGAYSPVGYNLHDNDGSVIVNLVGNDDKIFIRARSTVDGLPLRVDLQDNQNYHTSLAGLQQLMTTDFQVYEYNFAGNYQDGGYGGTACDPGTGPCPVDGERVDFLQMYLDPGVGAFNGELHIDWISFGEPLMVNVVDPQVGQSITIYPNPTKGQLNLDLATSIGGKVKTDIVDVNGRLVHSEILGQANQGNSSLKLDVSHLNPGMYILNISIDNQRAFYSKFFID